MPIPPMFPRRAAVCLAYLYAAWLVLQIFVGKFGLDALPKARFGDSIAAAAYRPFVFRALVPAVVRTVTDAVPPGFAPALVAPFYQTDALPVSATGYTLSYVVFCVVAWGCFVGFAFCVRALTRHFYPDMPPVAGDFAVPLCALLGLPLFFRHVSFVYDPATILLFPLALLCLVQKRYLLFFLVGILCALNKETAFLLAVPLFLHGRERGRHPALMLGLAALYVGVCFGVYRYITTSLADRPGGQVEWQIWYNLRLFLRYPWSFAGLIVLAALFAGTVARGWKNKPAFLRDSFVLMLLPHGAFLFCFGCLDEIRVFYELYGLGVLLMVPTVAAWVRETSVSDADGTPGDAFEA